MLQSKILRKTMALMAVLIATYIGSILIHAFPKINTKVTALEKVNVQEVLSKVVAIGKQGYAHIEEYEVLYMAALEKELRAALALPLQHLLEKQDLTYLTNRLDFLHTQLPFDEVGFFLATAQGQVVWRWGNSLPNLSSLEQNFLQNRSFLRFYTHTNPKEAYVAALQKAPHADYFIGAVKSIGALDAQLNQKEKAFLKLLDETMNAPRKINIGNSFVFNGSGEVLVAQDEDFKNIPLSTTMLPQSPISIFDAFTNAAQKEGTLHYRYPDSSGKFKEKILWIEHVPELNWFVGTTLYADELEIMSNKLQRIIATLGIIVFLGALIISFVFFKKLLQPISTLSKMANSATNGDYSVRSFIHSNDEIGELSKNFNTMIETIERNIEKEKQIMEQSRLAQMGEMMSMIAHQWRQPLGAIGSAVINMKMKLQNERFKDEKACAAFVKVLEKKLGNIEEYVEFLSTTVDDFRTFFKKNTQKESVPISEPIEKALQMIQASMASKNISIGKTYHTKDTLYIYVNELVQVLLNILKNSEDNFIEKQTPNPVVHITTQKIDQMYHITITDNGGGVPEAMLSKLCEPYFSTKHEKNGTGLGLYMSRVIIEEHHGGALHVKNVENGISFDLILPG